ncbi:MAG: MmgE/PrpD family protein, partial [Pseudomonadota bacterium]
MSLARAFGAFAAAAEPPGALARPIAAAVADGIGCILGGARSEVAGRVRAALGSGGAVPVLGTADRAPPGLAALRMAVAGHAHDFDDWEEPGNTHPTVVLFPAIFAAAHLAPVSGQRFLAAYAVGFEVIARLGQALGLAHYARGFHTTATLGALGAAAAAARALGLDAARAAHAIGLAASQAQGYTLQFGSHAKPLQAGAAARAGIEAALLARAGCTARLDVICDPRGMAGLLGTRDTGRIAAATARLGAPWAVAEFSIILKPWPSCGYTHRLMTAALELRGALAPAGALSSAEAVLPDFHRAILPFDRPETASEALFSIPACVAQILAEGDLTLADSAAGFWRTPRIRGLAERIAVTAVPARRPERNYDPEQPDRLVLEAGGARHEALCAFPLGSPQNPMIAVQLSTK